MKKKVIIGIIIVVLIIAVGVIGFLFLRGEEKVALSEAEVTELYNIIDEELYVLWNKDNINEITNQEKLQIAVETYAASNNYASYADIVSVSGSDLESFFSKTSLRNLELVHQDIRPFYKLYMEGDAAMSYNEETNEYLTNPFDIVSTSIEPYQEYLVDSYKEDNLYYISYKYVWIETGDFYPVSAIYPSYEDCLNETNAIYDENKTDFDNVDEETFISNDLIDYVNNNEDTIKENLTIYNYVFEKINDEYILVDFSRN